MKIGYVQFAVRAAELRCSRAQDAISAFMERIVATNGKAERLSKQDGAELWRLGEIWNRECERRDRWRQYAASD